MQTGRALTAAEFRDLLQDPNIRDLRGVVVDGVLILEDLAIRNADWGGCQIDGGIFIRNCIASNALSLRDASVNGAFVIDGLSWESGKSSGISAQGLRVSGDVRISNVVGGKLLLSELVKRNGSAANEELFAAYAMIFSGARIGGQFDIQSCDLLTPSLCLDDARVSGSLNLGAGIVCLSLLAMRGVEVGGRLTLSMRKAAASSSDLGLILQMEGSRISGSTSVVLAGRDGAAVVSMESVRVGGNCSLLVSDEISLKLAMMHAQLAGDLEVRGAEIERGANIAWVDLYSASVAGQVVVHAGLGSSMCLEQPLLSFVNASVGSYFAIEFRSIEGSWEFLKSTINDQRRRKGDDSGGGDNKAPGEQGASLIIGVGSVIGKDLSIRFSPAPEIDRRIIGPVLWGVDGAMEWFKESQARVCVLNLSRGRCESLLVENAPSELMGSVFLESAQTQAVTLRSSFLGGVRLGSLSSASLTMTDLIISGSIEARSASIARAVYLDHVFSTGMVRFDYATVGNVLLSFVTARLVSMERSSVRGQLALSTSTVSGLNLRHIAADDEVSITDSRMGLVDASSAAIEGLVIKSSSPISATPVMLSGQVKSDREFALSRKSHTYRVKLAWGDLSWVDISETTFVDSVPMAMDAPFLKELHDFFGVQATDRDRFLHPWSGAELFVAGSSPFFAINANIKSALSVSKLSFAALERRDGPLIDISDALVKRIDFHAPVIASGASDRVGRSIGVDWTNVAPRPIRMRGARIDTWDQLSAEHSASEYLDLFSCIEGFEADVYKNVEQMYADQGNLIQADRIYFERRRISRKMKLTLRGRLGWFTPAAVFEWLNEKLFGYGTKIAPWVTVAMLMWVMTFSGLFIGYESVFRVSDDRLAMLSDASGHPIGQSLAASRSYCHGVEPVGLESRPGVPQSTEWGLERLCDLSVRETDSLAKRMYITGFTSISAHLPMLDIDAAPHLSTTGKIFGLIPTSPWLQAMRLINWILLPVLLAVGVSRVMPKRYGGGS